MLFKDYFWNYNKISQINFQGQLRLPELHSFRQ